MIIKHFIEIKNRVFLIIFFYLFFFSLSYYYKNVILKLIILLNNDLSNQIFKYFIFTSITELFSTYIELNLFFCNYLSYFYVMYHFICFLSSGLYIKEYNYLKNFFFFSVLFGIISFIFNQKFMLPLLTNFFLSFHYDSVNYFYFEAKIYDYLKFYKKIFFTGFVNSQILAIIIIILNLINYYNQNFIKKIKKFIYFILLIFSTLLTPPDIFSQIFMFFFFIFCFELSVFLTILKKYLIR